MSPLADIRLPDIDGATRIIVDDAADVSRTEHETFDGWIDTPSKSAIPPMSGSPSTRSSTAG